MPAINPAPWSAIAKRFMGSMTKKTSNVAYQAKKLKNAAERGQLEARIKATRLASPDQGKAIGRHGEALKNWRANVVAEAPAPVPTSGSPYNPGRMYQGSIPQTHPLKRVGTRMVDGLSTL